jgi:chitodextrinase
MKIISWWRLARFSVLLLGTSSLVTATQAATYYVSPSGSDASSGTLAAPFATLQRAVNLVNPGDTIYMRGGTYLLSDSGVQTSRSGSNGSYISVFNYPGETPVLDGINITTSYRSAIALTDASWWHIRGLEIKNAAAHGIYLIGASSNNIIERNVTHHNVRIQLSGCGISVVDTGANNLILNNDSHHNGVLGSSGGDGIGVNYTRALGNIVRGNRVWLNNDDGIDLWGAANVLVENNWSWENGLRDDLTPSGGNGVGYKLGGAGPGDGNHTIRNNLAWRNEHSGFEDNGADLPMNVFNNTGYENGLSNFSFYSPVAFVLKNNLAFPNSLIYIRSPLVQSNNSWNLSVTVSSADFMSLDFSGATGLRNADGSLPTINFLKLAAGSNLIDKGVDVGLPYSGSAPDLGAYEYSPSADTQAPTTPTSLTATTISNSQIDLSWTASTDNVGVVGYNVYRDGVKIGTTASTTYSSTGLTAATTYSYSVTAFDAAGNTSAPSTSATARTAPTPDTTPPTVSIASPTGGTVSNTVAVSVNAADNVGVTRVDLRVNGVTAASSNVAPYQFAWNSTTVPNGPVALTAVAFDAAGNSTTSAAIALNVSNGPPPDTTPPTVSIASPTGGTVSNTVAVTVNAADNVGVTRVDLHVNGVTVGSGTAPPWQFSWDSRTVADGPVLLTAIAYDAAGNSTASLAVTVTASNASGNVALASAGAVPSASSALSGGYPVTAINDNERSGANWGSGGGWADATPGTFPDWVQINFNGTKTIDRVVLYTVQDNYNNPIEPTDSMTFAQYGITDFTVQGWNGSTWITLATVSGNNLVKRSVTFTAFITDRIRVNINNALSPYACITEIEAWGVDTVASPLNGSFEIPALGNSYQYGPSVSEIGWTFSGGSGIEGNGSAWGAASAPDGTQAAFIQGTGAIAQTFNLNAGSYTVSFQAAQRSCCISPYAQPVKISVDGVQIGSLVSPQSTSFAVFSISFMVSTSGPHTIELAGTDPSDKTTFIDAVTLEAVPSFLNGSFEIPALGSSYQYGPSVPEIGWTFSGDSGIEGNGSTWGAALAPDSTQAAFIQGTGTIAQTLNLNPGSYTLSFQAAQRSCCISPYAQPIKVSVDGVQIGSLVSPQSTSFAVFSIPFTVSTTGPHTIEFAGTVPSDNTTFIDAVMLAPSSIGTTESSPQ